MNSSIEREQAAYTFCVMSGALLYCPLHREYFWGSGDVNAAVAIYELGGFNAPKLFPNKAEAKVAVAAALNRHLRFMCANCFEGSLSFKKADS